MTSLAARVTMIEAVVTRLATSRGPKVSTLLREARAKMQAGQAPAPILHDIAELERQAAGIGLSAALARSRLRMLKGPPEPLLAGTVRGKDVDLDGGRGNPAAPCCDRPTALETALQGPSARGTLIDRIDQLLATAHG